MFLQHPCFIINNILLKTFVINSTLLLFLMVNPLYSQTYNQVYKAVASDRERQDRFGESVAISGDYAIAGAAFNSRDTSGLDSLYEAGAAYIYERNGVGNWSQKQKLVASDRINGDLFGASVSISGTTALVGQLSSGKNEGAYIFERDASGNWPQQQKISPPTMGIILAIMLLYRVITCW